MWRAYAVQSMCMVWARMVVDHSQRQDIARVRIVSVLLRRMP